MKRLVLLVVGLLFAIGTTVMAVDIASTPAKEEPAKVEKAAEEKSQAKARVKKENKAEAKAVPATEAPEAK